VARTAGTGSYQGRPEQWQRLDEPRLRPPGGSRLVPGSSSPELLRSANRFWFSGSACLSEQQRRLSGGQDAPLKAELALYLLDLVRSSSFSAPFAPEGPANGRYGMGNARPDPGRPGYSFRISLIRAIASSTACSGVMPSVTTRCTALPGEVKPSSGP
jgi:hypothetical protein